MKRTGRLTNVSEGEINKCPAEGHICKAADPPWPPDWEQLNWTTSESHKCPRCDTRWQLHDVFLLLTSDNDDDDERKRDVEHFLNTERKKH